MIRRPPRSTRTDTLFPYTTLFRSGGIHLAGGNIIDARIHTTRDGLALDNFLVQDPLGRPFAEAGQIQRLTRAIEDALANRQKRSEEHTSELQSLMRISYAVFCLKKKNAHNKKTNNNQTYSNQ